MAVTHIHKITGTVGKALDYGMNDKESPLKNSIHNSIAYATNDKTGNAIYYTLNAFQNCTQNTIKSEFERLSKDKIGKKKSREKNGNEVLAWHLIQSFDEEIPPVLANEIGQKLASEVFKDFTLSISTHTNTENVHNHFIICAWDKNGKKWNNCNANYQMIRNVSDRLCEEHGLNILLETQQVKLKKWKDSEDRTRYYEPTPRKNKIIDQRTEYDFKSVGDYRRSDSYNNWKDDNATSRHVVKNDIDNLLKSASSYEHLLSMLRELDYTIRDKKKNGDWLKHISFTPPSFSKGVRDSSLSDDGFYTRENLEAMINDGGLLKETDTEKPIKVISEYDYESVKVNDLDADSRAYYDGGNLKIVQRGNVDRDIVIDIINRDTELVKLYDTSTIKEAIRNHKITGKKHHKYYKKRQDILVAKIQESFNNLRFIEEKNIQSYSHINATVSSLHDKKNVCFDALEKVSLGIEKLNSIIEIYDKATKLKSSMESQMSDSNYVEFELNVDKELYNNYLVQLAKYKVKDKDSLENLRNKIVESEKKATELKSLLIKFEKSLNEYDVCMGVLRRIGNENETINNSEYINEYVNIRNESEKQNDSKSSRSKEQER